MAAVAIVYLLVRQLETDWCFERISTLSPASINLRKRPQCRNLATFRPARVRHLAARPCVAVEVAELPAFRCIDSYNPDTGAVDLKRVPVEGGRDALDPFAFSSRHPHTDAGEILLKDVADAPTPYAVHSR